jgi:hypothetical protein
LGVEVGKSELSILLIFFFLARVVSVTAIIGKGTLDGSGSKKRVYFTIMLFELKDYHQHIF